VALKNKRLVQRIFLELWNNGKLAVADEIFAANYARRDPTARISERDSFSPVFRHQPMASLAELWLHGRFMGKT
jgi:hypothetical protein